MKRDKCSFLLPKVEYIGHNISHQGLHPSGSKAAAANVPAPNNVAELWSLLGLVNYYWKLIPQLVSVLAPLYKLQRKGTSGPFMRNMFLVLVDAHSKWMISTWFPSATTQVTIDRLRNTFATLGLPEVLVADKGTSFTSAEFDHFCTRNWI